MSIYFQPSHVSPLKRLLSLCVTLEMSAEEELKKLLDAKEVEAAKKDQELQDMKGQMALLMENMRVQQEVMGQLQDQLKGGGASVVSTPTQHFVCGAKIYFGKTITNLG